MRLVRRRIPPGEFNHELIWLVISLAAVAGGSIWLGLGLAMPHCPFLAITGYPCLTCGATRCSIALLHGDLAGAWLWNPLAFIALGGVALFDLYAAIVLLAGLPRMRLVDWSATDRKAARIGVVVLIAVNWFYLLSHHGRY